jgi:hypothetical protein
MSKDIHARIETNRLLLKELNENIDKLNSRLVLAKTHLTNMCDTWEARFDLWSRNKNVDEYSYEELNEYVEAAKFLQSLGRKSNRIEFVEIIMQSM